MGSSRLNLSTARALIDSELKRYRSELQSLSPGLAPDLGRMLQYIHRHLFESNLSVGAVLRESGVRSKSVSPRFRLAVGRRPRGYIEHLRIEAAKRLLRHHELPVYLIGWCVGFEHLETFIRAFRRRCGTTPGRYRAAMASAAVVETPRKQRSPDPA